MNKEHRESLPGVVGVEREDEFSSEQADFLVPAIHLS